MNVKIETLTEGMKASYKVAGSSGTYYMDKYAVIYNPYMKKLFDFEENKIIRDSTDDPYGYDKWNMDWLDGKTFLTYDRQNDLMYKYTLDNDLRETIKLPCGLFAAQTSCLSTKTTLTTG